MEAAIKISAFLFVVIGNFFVGRFLAAKPDAVLRFTRISEFPSRLRTGRGFVIFVGRLAQVMSCALALFVTGIYILELFRLR